MANCVPRVFRSRTLRQVIQELVNLTVGQQEAISALIFVSTLDAKTSSVLVLIHLRNSYVREGDDLKILSLRAASIGQVLTISWHIARSDLPSCIFRSNFPADGVEPFIIYHRRAKSLWIIAWSNISMRCQSSPYMIANDTFLRQWLMSLSG